MERETERQVFHIIIGLIAMAAILTFGREVMISALFFTIIFGLLMMNMRIMKNKNYIVRVMEWFEKKFERSSAPLPGWGSACYATGALIATTVLTEVNDIAAVFVLLALGDGFSTLVGRMGRIKLPYNDKKTLEGMVAFFVSSLPAYCFVGPLAIPLALVGAVVETLPTIDDNLMIPIAATAFLVIF
jgi:dolichol kinase